jgi:hypothetical protein
MSDGAGTSKYEAILLLAHGTPDVLGEMAEYLTNVTGGHALPQEVVEELQHRYREIGLRETPGEEAPHLTKWTLTQGYLLEQALKSIDENTKVYVGMRNWHPYIADVVAQMRADGVTRFKAVCLAPQNSRTSVGLHRNAVKKAAAGMEMEFVAGWAENPTLGEAFAERSGAVYGALGSLPDDLDGKRVDCGCKAGNADAGHTGSVSCGIEEHGAERCRADEAAGDDRQGLVLRVPEPGRERRPVDWANGRGHAEGSEGTGRGGCGDAAGRLPVRPRRDSV